MVSPSDFGKISMLSPKSKLNAGKENDAFSGVLLVLLLRCKPSIWSGSGDGKWASGPGPVSDTVWYEFDRMRAANG